MTEDSVADKMRECPATKVEVLSGVKVLASTCYLTGRVLTLRQGDDGYVFRVWEKGSSDSKPLFLSPVNVGVFNEFIAEVCAEAVLSFKDLDDVVLSLNCSRELSKDLRSYLTHRSPFLESAEDHFKDEALKALLESVGLDKDTLYGFGDYNKKGFIMKLKTVKALGEFLFRDETYYYDGLTRKELCTN